MGGVHVCELILLLPTFWIFVSEILNFLACIAVTHFIGVINQHYKFPDPIWKMWHTIYCNIEGSLSLKGRLFFFGYTCYCSANHVMFCFCTVLFNSACCSLALRTDVQDKSTHLNTKFKEEISSYNLDKYGKVNFILFILCITGDRFMTRNQQNAHTSSLYIYITILPYLPNTYLLTQSLTHSLTHTI